MEELERALEDSKNRKSTGLGNIDVKLIKYGGLSVKFRIVIFWL